jgi:hypothetical protein
MILSAHQANFFPYEGVLEKIRRSDIFVALGYVQFTRGNYHNRFEHYSRWYTMSVNQSLEPLVTKMYCDREDWYRIKRRLPADRQRLDEFDEDIEEGCNVLVETNFLILKRLCRKLGIKTTLVRDMPLEGDASEKLANLCKEFGADTYLSGPTGLKYLDCAPFTERGVMVEFPRYEHKSRSALEMLAEVK